jgi:arginase family enzyme
VKTQAVFFPFDLFGSAGTGAGAELLADAFREMLADNQRESVPTRARAYQGQVQIKELAFADLPAYQDWREQGRRAVRQVLRKGHFLLWVTGNHLGTLPVYDELAAGGPGTLVIQLDAHLDIYNLADCKTELSHGNFLLHCDGPLPAVINIGHRDLFLRPDFVKEYYQHVVSAAALAVNAEPALAYVRKASHEAKRVLVDIDCDVFDPAFLPAVGHPLPFGLSSALVLRFLEAAWSGKVVGVALSEFDPGRDRNDHSLTTLVWLLEYILLRKYEGEPGASAPGG